MEINKNTIFMTAFKRDQPLDPTISTIQGVNVKDERKRVARKRKNSIPKNYRCIHTTGLIMIDNQRLRFERTVQGGGES